MAEHVILRTVRANGVTLGLREWGTPGQPPLLLVPGTGLAGALFADAERLLWADWHGYSLDRRAHGLSERPADGYDWVDFADDLVSVVEALELEDLTGVGHSAGGTDALLAAAREPGRWRAIAAIEPSVQDPRRPVEPQPDAAVTDEVVARFQRRRPHFPSFGFAVERFLSNPGFAACRIERVRAYLAEALDQQEDGTWTLRCPPEAEMRMTMPIRAVMNHHYLPPAGRNDPFPSLLELRVPTDIYATELSGGFYPGMARIAAEVIPGARHFKLPGLNHIVPLQSPETIAMIAERLRFER